MIKGAIFDLDGTLLDSMFIWETFGAEYLKLFGIETEEKLSETFKTFTLEQSAEYFRQNYAIERSAQEIVDDIKNLVAEIYRTRVNLKPGVRDFLKRLYANGVKMCIATVTDRPIVEDVLKRLGVLEYFSGIFTCAEVGYDKTTPHIYRKALSRIGAEKSETVVFEDVLHGLETAKNDGFLVAAVYDKYEPEQVRIQEISDYYITDFDKFCLPSKMKTALTIAGSDSCGGAGIQADIKTMAMNGVYAMSAITALTAQNTLGVKSIQESTPEFLRQQIDAVFEDIFPDSIKIGMVSSSCLIDVIADRLTYYNAKNIVVDPVMVATSGSALIKTEAIQTLVSKLLPLATVVTPNIPEAEVLSDMKICDTEDMIKAAEYIGDNYGCAVLLKGGHNINDANDLLYENGSLIWLEGKRIQNTNTHGTGCTLSSAIASNLANGLTLTEAVRKAKKYITGALSDGLDLGNGSGPLNHAFVIKNIT